MNRTAIIGCILFLVPVAASAQDILLRQNNGTYQSVDPGGSKGEYDVRSPYPGATWAPVYDSKGKPAGSIETDAGGTVLYDNKGRRK